MNACDSCSWKGLGRYVLAALTIPIGVGLGVSGLAQNWSRALRSRPRRTRPEPAGRPTGSGLRRAAAAP